ncbi:hypothetical protein C1I95_32965 [Micromonospora craterilacus]|uniref:Uncharacterized protein n=1 Tax=Micromonospora craterilacus TaxID=1655439 RepID=A0A2W2DII2_9ACTN|nr:hypothetical protein [Micromonospora craterilacus]PZG04945.1 hypothetical protein C1I95_32965 [Micromonospora craterilacus]
MENHSKPRRLAATALHAAIEQDWRRATAAVERLNTECTAEGLWDALVGWCDTFAAHAAGGDHMFGRVRLLGWNTDTGAVGEEPPTAYVRWALDLIGARAAGDIAAFQAVVQRLNDIDDGFERGRYVSALLTSIAETMRSLPRGYANTGRAPAGGGDGA